jgi:integrase
MPKCLSDAAVRNATAKTKPYKLSDGDGLFLLVTPSGSKYWRLKYFFAGKEKLLALGVYPDVALADARERRAQARKVLAAGNDPGEAKKEAKRFLIDKHTQTFEAVTREWHQNRQSKWTPLYAKKTLKRLETQVFPKLGTRPIADITTHELLSVMRRIEEHSADLAHRQLQICGQVFSYAVITQRATNNPTASLRGALKPVVKTTHAYIKPNELKEYLKNLECYDGSLQTQLAMKFLLLTFVRTGELRGATWAEIDLDNAEWRIPAERMKMRDPHIVPLSRQAAAILTELHAITGQWKYVFPNQHKPSGHMSENTILYALYRMGYHSRATGHGFRSTASTVLNEHGFSPDVIERQLAHGERNKVRAAYNHAQYLPERRKMMQWWADYLDEVGKKANQAKKNGKPVPDVDK